MPTVKKPDLPGPVPAEAIDYFKRKKLKPAFSYLDVWQEEHDLAFTVAKVVEADLLGHVRETIGSALKNGETFETWKENALPALEQSGWRANVSDAQLPSRLKTIFQTNMRVARANGQEDRAQRVKKALPFFMYEIGPSKNHRPEHVAWNGKIFAVDDPWWETHTPPCAYGCHCRKRQISRVEAEKRGGVSEPPDEKQVKWEFPDGKTSTVPAGVHPSFAYRKNAKQRREQLEKEVQSKGQGPTEVTRELYTPHPSLFTMFKEFVLARVGGDHGAKTVASSLTDGARRVLIDLCNLCPTEHDTTGFNKFDVDAKTARKYLEGELFKHGLIGRRQNKAGLFPTERGRAVRKFL